jgi:hypothetical protein
LSAHLHIFCFFQSHWTPEPSRLRCKFFETEFFAESLNFLWDLCLWFWPFFLLIGDINSRKIERVTGDWIR